MCVRVRGCVYVYMGVCVRGTCVHVCERVWRGACARVNVCDVVYRGPCARRTPTTTHGSRPYESEERSRDSGPARETEGVYSVSGWGLQRREI